MFPKHVHQSIYIVLLMILAACLPLSHFGMGLTSFLLLLHWIAEWNWKEKWACVKSNKEGLLFAGLFVVSLLGLFKTELWSVALQNTLSKLPLLFAPLIIISTSALSKKELQWVCKSFVYSTLFCCVCSIIYWLSCPVDDIRQISIFIDHIRFSLCIVLSTVFCFHFFIQGRREKQGTRLLFVVIIIAFVCYLFIAQTLTGIFILLSLLLLYLCYLLVKQPAGKLKYILSGSLFVLLFSGIAYVTYLTFDYTRDKDKEISVTHTSRGNAYEFGESVIENGHRINYYVCKPELKEAWTERSSVLYDDLIEQTLIRYLNSKGLHKDYEAVMMLTDEDIHHVENKIANYDYTRTFGLRRSIYQTLFGLSMHSVMVEGSSLMERVELWRASALVIRDHWFLGVGIGDYKAALDQQLEAQNSTIAYKKNRGSHNQWLTFWMMGGILLVLYFLFILFYPFVKMRDKISLLYVALMVILLLSMFTEDTLESQTGKMLYALFAPLLLYSEKE